MRAQAGQQVRVSWRGVTVVGFAIAIVLAGGVMIGRASAETYPGGTDNGLTSRIGELNTTLTGLGYGSTTDAPDWGNTWNRIKTSATWAPDGDAAPSDVAVGKTFYGDNRTQQTGTRPVPGLLSNQVWHDSSANATQANNGYIEWTTPTDGIAGTDKQDPVTGLIWSHRLRNNSGTIEFSPTAPSTFSWDNSHTNNEDRTASQLCSDRGDGWRLPTQKELMQAYVDGSYWNLSQPAANHWSVTESSDTIAWYVYLSYGTTSGNTKSNANGVRCVR